MSATDPPHDHAWPSVSLIIVSRGRAALLRHTLSALRFQRLQGFEVIVVSDAPRPLMAGAPFPLTEITFDEPNISRARNLGLAQARGAVVAFLDDDAVPEFGWLAALTAAFAHPRVGAATGYVRGRNGVSFQWRSVLVDRAGRDALHWAEDGPRIFPPGSATLVKTVGCNAAFRRKALEEVGGFDEAFHFFLDDVDLNVRLNQAGWMTAVIPAAEVHHAYAAGPYRTARRAPTSLFQIGASRAYFCAKHLPQEAAKRAMGWTRRDEARRLERGYLFALFDAETAAALADSLEAGIRAGAARQPDSPALAPAPATLAAPTLTAAPRRFFASTRRGLAAQRAAAAAAAADGAEVTLITLDPGFGHLSVGFDSDGFWHHRIGTFGRTDRHRPWRPRPLAERVRDELSRIAPQRGLTEDDAAQALQALAGMGGPSAKG